LRASATVSKTTEGHGTVSARRGVTAEEVERFRVALRDRVNRSTLRSVAVEVGISPSGLSKLMDGGTTPYAPTVERLRSWYYRKTGVHQRPPGEIAAILRHRVVTLPEPDAGVLNLIAAVDASRQQAGMYAPEWGEGSPRPRF
jgi:hypothetical protein